MLLTPEISTLIAGGGRELGFPRARAAVIVDRYLAGHLLSVGMTHNEKERADLEQLHHVDEVWALCIRKPRPGWRILGRFVERDTFVGLRAHDRRSLGGKRYKVAAEDVIERWRLMFGTLEPLRGHGIEDYLSGVLRDVNQAY